MKYTYVAVFTPAGEGRGYDARVPDIPNCFSRGETFDEAIDMITDAASVMLTVYEDDHMEIPAATHPTAVSAPENGFTSVLQLDTDKYRMMTNTHTVRKSVSIPAWMDQLSQRNGISLSQALQEALRARLEL